MWSVIKFDFYQAYKHSNLLDMCDLQLIFVHIQNYPNSIKIMKSTLKKVLCIILNFDVLLVFDITWSFILKICGKF